MRDPIFHHDVDGVEDEPECVSPLSRDEARVISVRATVD
jgi:hypothetical protein